MGWSVHRALDHVAFRAILCACAWTLGACTGDEAGGGGGGGSAGAGSLTRADAGMDAGADAAKGDPLPLAPGRPPSLPFHPSTDAGEPSDGGIDGGPSDSLGARCQSDRDCLAPLTCLEVNEDIGNGEGPPRGLCTIKCSATSTTCADFGGICVDLTYTDSADSRYCVETCTFGPGDEAEFSPDKCHGREEFSCYPLATGPACIPNCNGDGDCGTRICNPGTGMCGATTPPGDAIGAKCDPDATTDTCHGYCQRFTLPDAGVVGSCMEDCTWGRVATCGWTGAGAASTACFLVPTSVLDAGGPGYGDVGHCVQLCDCNKDCANPGFVCEPLGLVEYETYWGRKGLCTLKGSGGDLPTCPATM